MKLIKINLAITILILLLQGQSVAAKAYVPGIRSLDFTTNKFSDLMIAQWQTEIWKALHLDTDRVDGQACLDNYIALMDTRYALNENVTRTQELNTQQNFFANVSFYFLQANTSLKLAEIASTELADTIETCTTVATESWQATVLRKNMYFNSGSTIMQMLGQLVTYEIGNVPVYNKVLIQLKKGWSDGNWPLFFSSFLEAFWATIWWDNMLYDPEGDPVPTEPFEFPDWRDYVPDFIKGYLAPAPSFEKAHKTTPRQVQHPRVQQDIIVEPVEYVIPNSYNTFIYTMGVGFLEKYSEYFEYQTRINTCDTQVRIAEQRFAKFNDDYYPSPDNWEGTFYDFVDGKAKKLADTLRVSSIVTYNCQLGWKEDFYDKVYYDLAHMTLKDRVQMWLLHDLKMYDDVLKIIELTENGIIWNEYHFLYSMWKIGYSIAIVALHVPNTNQDEFPYPNDGTNSVEERQITNQMRDAALTDGIDYRSIGSYLGNIWALITMPQPEEETDEEEAKGGEVVDSL